MCTVWAAVSIPLLSYLEWEKTLFFRKVDNGISGRDKILPCLEYLGTNLLAEKFLCREPKHPILVLPLKFLQEILTALIVLECDDDAKLPEVGRGSCLA